jgi:1-deoxy-D-xylulose-5-phosphate reductoisomerase
MEIGRVVQSVLDGLSNRTPSGLADVLDADADARRAAREFIAGGAHIILTTDRTGSIDRAMQ